MQIPFTKYHGTGNDFILIDKRHFKPELSKENIALLCHRRLGIGADGLIYLTHSSSYDFEMVYFNSDGNEGSMCGNGGRCITAFANQLGIIEKKATFLATDGKHQSDILEEKENKYLVKLQLGDVNTIVRQEDTFEINTGSPHYIEFTNKLDKINILEEGRKIRYSKRFSPEGINVNFAEIHPNKIIVRTYERGVEDITLSCGTGVTATALAAAEKSGLNSGSINISTLGGILKVYFKKTGSSYQDIQLEGAAIRVFSGIFEL